MGSAGRGGTDRYCWGLLCIYTHLTVCYLSVHRHVHSQSLAVFAWQVSLPQRPHTVFLAGLTSWRLLFISSDLKWTNTDTFVLSTGKMTPRYIKANFRWGQLKYSQQTSSSWSQDCALAKVRSRILNNKINSILCSAALQQFGCDYVDCFCYLLYWRQRPYCSLRLLSQGDDGGMIELPKLGFLRVYGCYPQTHSRGISPRVSSRGDCYIFISYDHLEAELHVRAHKSSQEEDSVAFWQRKGMQTLQSSSSWHCS